MLMKKYSLQWTPGVCVDQFIDIALDGPNFTTIANGLVKDVADYIILVPATTKNASVRIGSRAPGQLPVFSEELIFAVADVVIPIILTPATGLSVTLIGEEEVI